MNKTIQVRVLYSQGGPNLPPTIDIIHQVGKEIGVQADIETVMVASADEAVNLRCLGSPTVQINGVDIDPEARESIAFGLG